MDTQIACDAFKDVFTKLAHQLMITHGFKPNSGIIGNTVGWAVNYASSFIYTKRLDFTTFAHNAYQKYFRWAFNEWQDSQPTNDRLFEQLHQIAMAKSELIKTAISIDSDKLRILETIWQSAFSSITHSTSPGEPHKVV